MSLRRITIEQSFLYSTFLVLLLLFFAIIKVNTPSTIPYRPTKDHGLCWLPSKNNMAFFAKKGYKHEIVTLLYPATIPISPCIVNYTGIVVVGEGGVTFVWEPNVQKSFDLPGGEVIEEELIEEPKSVDSHKVFMMYRRTAQRHLRGEALMHAGLDAFQPLAARYFYIFDKVTNEKKIHSVRLFYWVDAAHCEWLSYQKNKKKRRYTGNKREMKGLLKYDLHRHIIDHAFYLIHLHKNTK